MKEETLTKIWATLIVFFSSLFFGLAPLKVKKLLTNSQKITEKTSKLILSCCLLFGAGILFGTTFLHILVEVRESFESLEENGTLTETEYPLAELIICSGFFLIYILEETVHYFIHFRKSNKSHPHHQHNHFRRNSAVHKECTPVTIEWNHETNAKDLKNGSLKSQNDDPCENSEESPSNNDGDVHDAHVAIFRSIMIVIALSFHSCFEGLALGLADTSNDVWLLCVALVAHKIFIAFSIGLELLENGMKKWQVILQMTIFSLACPIGAIVGIILSGASGFSSAENLAEAILEGISGGTILYVVFCEILERERMKPEGKFVKFTSLLIGFTFLACLQIFHVDSDHSTMQTSSVFTTQSSLNPT